MLDVEHTIKKYHSKSLGSSLLVLDGQCLNGWHSTANKAFQSKQ